MNYHQNDINYNKKWWGRGIEFSECTYSFVASATVSHYMLFRYAYILVCILLNIDHLDKVHVATYYFWVKNSNIIFEIQAKH